jgi:hypothetical protein
MTYNPSMFQSIKNALANNQTSESSTRFKNILKFEAGNTYVLRLLPNIKDLSKTFFHFYQHGWKSYSTGNYISTLSLQTIGKPDPISKERYRMTNSGTPEEREKAKNVRWQEQWYVNVYIVDDPVNPENNGTVKVFRYGKKLDRLIKSAIEGDDADEFGPRVFDLSSAGVNLKLKVEKQGDFISYDSSRFTSPNDLHLSEEDQEKIYDSVHDLTAINQIKTEAEIIELWNTHFLCISTEKESPSEKTEAPKATVSKAEETADSEPEMSPEQLQSLLKTFQVT